MDNASYHHQLSTEFYPKGVTPRTASKPQNALALIKLKVRSIKVPRVYGGKGSGTKQFEKCNVRGCWDTALAEMNHWIAADLKHNPGDDGRPRGLTGEMGQLGGAEGWTRTDPTCTDIHDIDVGDGTDIVHSLGEEAENIAQECIEVAAAHIGGGDV